VTKSKKLFIPYITAGFPSKKLFLPILKTLSENGADFIEVGVPHSDPLADGPTIQMSSKAALENGVSLKWIVQTLRSVQTLYTTSQQIKPLILFTYLNPVLNYGLEKLLKDLPKPLFYGVLIPDLPLEEAEKYLPLFKKYKLNLILLIAPNTNKNKVSKIVKACHGMPHNGGFIYLVSVTGTTGVRKKLSSSLKSKIKEIKSFSDIPIAVGFGISNATQAKEVLKMGADGVVVGSAIIKLLESSNGNSMGKLKSFAKSFKSN
jgi:tryptophan synthase alpha chain